MDMHDDGNHDLRDLFDREHRQLPPEPFLKTTAARIASARARATLIKRVIQAAGLALVILGSPWLISGSVVLSAQLDAAFAAVAAWLSTRTGTAAALLCVLAVVVWRRRRAFY